MKKFLSISFALLILASGMHITIATHFCGGVFAKSTVSVSGKLASCGMEDPAEQCPSTGNHIHSSCCSDKIALLAVDNNYAPSFSEFKIFPKDLLQVYTIPADVQLNLLSSSGLSGKNVSPPGNYAVSDVSLPKICVFRI